MRRPERRQTRVAPVNLFLPPQLPGLVQWVRGDLGITLNGADVSLWTDQGPSPVTYSMTTAARQPAYGYATTNNGRPALTFSGTAAVGDEGMLCGPLTVGHVFVVAKFTPATIPYDYCGLWVAPSGSDAKWNMLQCGTATLTTWYSTPAAGVTRWKDGVADNAGIGVQAQHIYEIQDTSPSSHDYGLLVGGGNTTNNPAWPGWVAEIIVYSAILSTANAAKVRRYLVDRYNITGVTL